MRNFKKPILALILIGIVTAVLSVAMVYAYIKKSTQEFDIPVRNAYAGQIDTLFVGMSEMRQAAVPAVIDEKCGIFSYNLSGGWQSLYATIMLLEEELARNDVKTLVLELSSTVISLTPDNDYREGSTLVIPRLMSTEERIDYIKNWTLKGNPIKNYLGFVQKEGMRMVGVYDFNTTVQDKGFCPYYSVDAAISIEQAKETFAKEQSGRLTPENAERIRSIAQMCKDRGIRLICVTPVMSPAYILTKSGWDDTRADIQNICNEIGADYIDFNLIKDRFTLFDDHTSFGEYDHLSEAGAYVFSPLFAEVIAGAQNDEAIEFDSYDNYIDMMKDSPYGELYD